MAEIQINCPYAESCQLDEDGSSPYSIRKMSIGACVTYNCERVVEVQRRSGKTVGCAYLIQLSLLEKIAGKIK